MNIAIIPARGGSKRIPRKNIRDFHGKPIIAYSIQAALDSGLFDKVIVSTDDAEISAIAKNCGAEVPFFRSAKNSDDFATTSDVLLEVLAQFNEANHSISTLCCIYPTAPLIQADDLRNASKVFIDGAFDTLISSVAFSFPIQRSFQLNDAQKIVLNHPEAMNSRSQDLATNFHDAGAFYFLNASSFQQSKSIWSGEIGAFVLPESKVQDIDTTEDWKLAELKYALLK